MKPANQNRSSIKPLLYLMALLTAVTVVYFYGEKLLRALMLYLSTAGWARETATELPVARSFAGRFIAGQTIADAIVTAREMNEKGISVTINYLGESVTNPQEAVAARDEILRLIEAMFQNRINDTISVKPSQLGLHLDPELLHDNMRILLRRAKGYNIRLRMDMEDHTTIDNTLAVYHALRDQDGFQNAVGVVIQAYLYRSEADIQTLVEQGGWVRLCKGAYAEPPHVAFPDKADVDANYVHLMQMMLSEEARANGMDAAFATHDEAIIQTIQHHTASHQIPSDAFEFQMLYGIRQALQEQLVAQGYRVRVYIPYGTAWYPYFMRRLAERPANLWFFASNLLR